MAKVVGTPFVELRSEEVQELLTRPPKWLLRWGITVVFFLLILILIGAWVIHYPDLVRASFKLTSADAPKAVLTRTDGKIVRLLAHEGQSVVAGTSLAYLESTARHEEVLHLSEELAKAWTIASRGDLEALKQLHLSTYSHLGELQNAYQTFEQTEIQLGAYLANGFFSKKKLMLQQEIVDFQTQAANLEEQRNLQGRDMKLAEEDYAIQQQLADQKVIAPLELKREESKMIARHLPYQQTSSAIVTNLTDQRMKRKEILELERQVAEERDKFLQALNTLQSAVDTWKVKYILTAPVSGRVFFTGTLQENQAVAINQDLFYVAPPTIDYYGELHIPQQNAGKVLVGQDVLIKFAGFPYHEFGFVRGRITSIADIPLKDSIFLAKVMLPDGLKTNYGQSLSFKTGMAATADIITADTRLLEKLFYQLRKAINAR